MRQKLRCQLRCYYPASDTDPPNCSSPSLSSCHHINWPGNVSDLAASRFTTFTRCPFPDDDNVLPVYCLRPQTPQAEWHTRRTRCLHWTLVGNPVHMGLSTIWHVAHVTRETLCSCCLFKWPLDDIWCVHKDDSHWSSNPGLGITKIPNLLDKKPESDSYPSCSSSAFEFVPQIFVTVTSFPIASITISLSCYAGVTPRE